MYLPSHHVDKEYCKRFIRKNKCKTIAVYFIKAVDRKEHRGVYVRFLEMCYNPIGRDDTRRSDVWGLYRDGLCRGKKSKKIEGPRYR